MSKTLSQSQIRCSVLSVVYAYNLIDCMTKNLFYLGSLSEIARSHKLRIESGYIFIPSILSSRENHLEVRLFRYRTRLPAQQVNDLSLKPMPHCKVKLLEKSDLIPMEPIILYTFFCNGQLNGGSTSTR